MIKAENLGKCYQIKHRQRERYVALRDVLTQKLRSLFKTQTSESDSLNSDEEFWALKNGSFEIKAGEVVGIVGRNGAGKSTLLKILSRITEPTYGRARLRGRVASLLEVGTGFHPELTGRENIYLNGAILGMRRQEIQKKFDEIVAFSEVEKFLDTPVKRYSSGMYVRLAFAVAAHLESEILIVDEVLAVGDAAFQAKCLGKMSSIAKGNGRTVLFVSHNMAAVLSLCDRAVYFEDGQAVADGKTQAVLQRYLQGAERQAMHAELFTKRRVMLCRGKATLTKAMLIDTCGLSVEKVSYGEPFAVEIEVRVDEPLDGLDLGIAISTLTGFEIASSLSSHSLELNAISPGVYVYIAKYLNLSLIPGLYNVGFGLRSDRGLEDYISDALGIEVNVSELAAQHQATTFGGVIVPEVEYQLSKLL